MSSGLHVISSHWICDFLSNHNQASVDFYRNLFIITSCKWLAKVLSKLHTLIPLEAKSISVSQIFSANYVFGITENFQELARVDKKLQKIFMFIHLFAMQFFREINFSASSRNCQSFWRKILQNVEKTRNSLRVKALQRKVKYFVKSTKLDISWTLVSRNFCQISVNKFPYFPSTIQFYYVLLLFIFVS